jgi:hypothetical protein
LHRQGKKTISTTLSPARRRNADPSRRWCALSNLVQEASAVEGLVDFAGKN